MAHAGFGFARPLSLRFELKIAPTGSLLFSVIEQVGAVNGGAGTAVSVTVVPTGKFPVQAAPEAAPDVQLMPAGLLVTVPVPNPTS